MAASLPHDALRWERECVSRARAGDREAFAQLYRAFAPGLYQRVLLPKLGHAQAAEDALAETFRVLLEQLATLDTDEQSLWPWLCRVASNKAIDQHRKASRTRRALTNFERLLAPVMGDDAAGGDPSRGVDRERLERLVAQRMEGLLPRYRRALELRFLQDQSREECARQMELKLGTFDVLLLRALRAFRQQWELHSSSSERDER